MNALFSVVRSSVRSRRLASTLLLLAVLTLAAAGITAARTARAQAATVVDREFERTRGPHLVVYSTPQTDPQVQAVLGGDREVTEVAGPIGWVLLGASVSATDMVRAQLIAYDASHPWPIANPILRRGRWAGPEAADEVVVDHSLAENKGLRIGQRLPVGYGDATVQLTIVGTALDFTDCFIPDCYPPRFYASPIAQQRLAAASGEAGSLILARAVDAAMAPAVEARLRDQLGETVGSNSWPDTRHDLLQRDEGFGTFLRGFGTFVLLASCFVVGSALTARAVARRREIGLLKAIGFSQGQVMGAVLVEHIALGAIASVAGWLVAGVLTSRLRVGSVRLLSGTAVTLSLTGLLMTLVIVLAAMVIATLLPALRWGRVEAGSALRDTPVGAAGNSRFARAVSRLGAPMPAILGARDLSARPIRSALTAATVCVMTIVSVMSIGLISSMQRVQSNPSLQGNPWDVQSPIPDGMPRDEFGARLQALPEVRGWFIDNDVKASLAGRPFLARIMGGPPEAAEFVVREGRPLRAAGEAIAGYGFLHKYRLEVGDRVTVSLQGQPIALTIVGRYSETEDSGVVLRLREESLPPTVNIGTSALRIVATDGVDARALALKIDQQFGVTSGWISPDDDLDEFIAAAKVMAGVIAAVVVAHVFASLLTSARERVRDFGVQRAMGFTNGQLIGQGASGAALLAIAAVLGGLPLGWLLNSFAGTLLSKEVGAGPGLTVGPPITPVAAAIALIIMTAMVVGALSTGTVLRRDTAALVRTVD